MAHKYRLMDQPVMSDKTILTSVEDLIYRAFTFYKDNRVDFKLIQTICFILARELRLLQQDVEIKFDVIENQAHDNYESGSYSSSSEEDERGIKTREKKDRAGKEEKRDKKDRGKKGDTQRGGKNENGEKEEHKGRRGKGEKEDGKTSSKHQERKGRSKDRDEKDERSRGRDKSSKGRDEKDEMSRGRDKSSKDRDEKDEWSIGRDKSSKDRDEKDERSRGRDKSSKDRDEKDQSSRERDKSSRRKSGDDDGDEGGRERGRGRERGGERGADGGGGIRGEREADGRGGRGGEREDRDAQRQDRRGIGREFGSPTGTSSGTSITVSEATRRGLGGKGSADKILVAERGPAARGRSARIGSIEVVTASQFALLGKAVKQLEQITGPLPAPVLPKDQTLRQDLAKGRASLQDTMQAMQLNERVQAAEQGLNRLAELLTELAQSDTLPPEFADHLEAMEEYLQNAIAEGYAAAGPGGPDGRGKPSMGETASTMDAKKSPATVNAVEAAAAAAAAEVKGRAGVTHHELFDVMQNMQETLMKEVNSVTARAKHSAEVASNTSRTVAEKVDTAVQVNTRIDTLFQQTEEYNQQLSGFDSGVVAQVKNFQQHLVNLKNDLAEGLALLDVSNNNAETAALLEMTERHQSLVDELENTNHLHQNLYVTQHQITDELRNVIKSVEILREQKSERDEMLDGLKHKANISCLAGLLDEKAFTIARSDMEKRLAKCYEKFNSKNAKWQDSLKELITIANNKGEMIMLMSLKDASDLDLNAIQKLLHKLEIMLGEPKAAILMRKLAKDATCAACLTRALMEPEDLTHGKPLPLPALRPPPLFAEGSGEVKLAPPDIRDHTCRRWVGGSHTLMADNIVKEQAEPMQLQVIPTKRFEGTGSDGRYYLMEEDMQPCAECNKLPPCACPPVRVGGARARGEQASGSRPRGAGLGEQASGTRPRGPGLGSTRLKTTRNEATIETTIIQTW